MVSVVVIEDDIVVWDDRGNYEKGNVEVIEYF